MKKITETQLQILERLNDYRFLTVAQMQRIGIAKNPQTIHKALKAMRDAGKKLIDYADFGTFPTIGRLPRIHYLTKHGAKLLAEALRIDQSEVQYPKGVKVFSRDYFHRVETIDLHILARTFCEAHEGVELDFFQAYFEHTGANHWGDPSKPKRDAVNKIIIDENTALIPDCVFRISDPNGKPFLFVGEIYRGHSTKRLQHQLYKYLASIQTGAINNVYNYLAGFPILIICETEKSMLSLMNRIKNDAVFQHVENYFLFRTLDQVGQGVQRAELLEAFAMGWKTYTGKEMGLFR